MKNKHRRLIFELLRAVLVILSAAGIYLGLQYVLSTSTPWVAVASESMSPALEMGDLIIIQGVSPSNIHVGDIVVFDSPQGGRTIHRVMKTQSLPNGTLQFMTRGDANPSEDLYWISQQYIIGKALYRIPYLGWLALDPAILILTTATIVITILLWPESSRRRKHVRNRYS